MVRLFYFLPKRRLSVNNQRTSFNNLVLPNRAIKALLSAFL